MKLKEPLTVSIRVSDFGDKFTVDILILCAIFNVLSATQLKSKAGVYEAIMQDDNKESYK